MLGLGSSLSGGSFNVEEAFNYISLNSSDIFTGTDSYTGPVSVISTTSISVDDSEQEGEGGLGEIQSKVVFYLDGSAFSIPSGTTLKFSGRATLQGTSAPVEDADNDGFIILALQANPPLIDFKVYIDKDYSGSITSGESTKVDADGYFTLVKTLTREADDLIFWIGDVKHDPNDANKRLLLSELSLTIA